MDYFTKLFSLLYQLLRHLGEDQRWRDLIQHVGGSNVMYVVLFAIVFAETGLVIIPFLPGDSLLFATGAMGARDIGINVPLISVLLIVAAVLGDAVNYSIGKRIGPAVFSKESAKPNAPSGTQDLNYGTANPTLITKLLNKDHLLKAQAFYDKHGGKTIILARFVPIVRTFAPFVAGIGKMSYPRFFAYNVVGAIAWVVICVGAGFLFGNIEWVKKNFEAVILAIIFISVIPVGIEFWKAKREAKRPGGADPLVTATTLGEKPEA